VSELPPDQKPLETTSLVIHATRGVIRDREVRRKMMLGVLILAFALLLGGLTVLRPLLNAHEHPWRVIIFWVICIWLTFTAFLLAFFDLLMVRAEARKAERALRESLKRADKIDIDS
jgi:hypothetical protein